ncbi:hemerythrin domain-containing protein [Ramlibacter alkalitolerans]|uniref:Hemerythrin domain-containing protein n=1 Tax=Ramlibacter alkalitolerans TaxID=2039631 RepID=A0ABS1JP29_9BURK|nr:hemerythrin domain-containing protein [Ramlibacter alkalitolerans]MBL0425626.1 hemerythrin domain-containing protein [Ramlibacter alkalitolerans]
MNPVTAWHDEHAYFGRLLDLLQEEVDRLYAGESPHYELVLDIVAYLRDYSDQVHHPREDEAFRRLARRCPELQPTIARLQQEHRVIAQSGVRLRELVEEAAVDAVVPRAQIEAAAATYIVYYRSHIATEEQEILPAAARELTDVDWTAARNAAPSRANPLASDGAGERFRSLRRRIASEAGHAPRTLQCSTSAWRALTLRV